MPTGGWFTEMRPVRGEVDAWAVAPSDEGEREAIQGESVLIPPATEPRLPYRDSE
jgi:hypothetical protein